MAVFNNNMTIGHGSHVKESATDFKLSLNGVSVSANSKQIVFASGNRKKTLLMDESVLSAPRPGGIGKPNMEEEKTEFVRSSIVLGNTTSEVLNTKDGGKIVHTTEAVEGGESMKVTTGCGVEVGKERVGIIGGNIKILGHTIEVEGGFAINNHEFFLNDTSGNSKIKFITQGNIKRNAHILQVCRLVLNTSYFFICVRILCRVNK
jgi:hypothetical protein